MEKDPTTHRRHRPGPGAQPSGITHGYLKAACEGAELQRSRSVGGLHQKGDPPVCIRKLHKELDSEDQGKDPRSDTDDTTCQASLEEDRQKKNQDEVGKLDHKYGETDTDKSDSETSATREQDDACKERFTSVAKEQGSESTKLDHLLEKQKPCVFVEIDLGDHTEEEIVTCAVREGKSPIKDTGDLSEDETRTSWVCCIPYSTKKKTTKENTSALENAK